MAVQTMAKVTHKTPLVGLVVVHYGSVPETLDLLNSLNKLKYPQLNVYVVDNDPRNPLPKTLPVKKHQVERINSKTNKGWAGGANLGAKRAVSQKCEVVTFFTSDLLVTDPQFLHKMLAPILAGKSEVCLPMVVYASNPNRIWMIGGTMDETWLLVKHNHFNHLVSEIDTATLKGDYGGIGTTITANALKKINFWTEDYFLYFEDVDFYYKLAGQGVFPSLVPAARLHHATSSVKEKTSKKMELISAFCFGRSGLIFADKYLSNWQKVTAFLGWFCYRTPIFVGGMVLQQHFSAIWAYLHGVWEGMLILLFDRSLAESNQVMEYYR